MKRLIYYLGRAITDPYDREGMTELRQRFTTRGDVLTPVRMTKRTAMRLAADIVTADIYYRVLGESPEPGARHQAAEYALSKLRAKLPNACSWPGCGSHVHIHAHHIKPRSNGGENSIENLVALCPAHHYFVHGLYGLGFRPENQADIEQVARLLQPCLDAIPKTTEGHYSKGFS